MSGVIWRGEETHVKCSVLQLNTAVALLVVIGTCGGRLDLVAADGAAPLVLESPTCRVEVERQQGRLLRLRDGKGQIDLKSPTDLAENFRVLVPLPDAPRNFVHGKNQTLCRAEASSGRLVLHWDGPMKDERGNAHDLAATLHIELKDEAVEFRFSLTNSTAFRIPEVWYPAIGGLHAFGPPAVAAKTTLNPPPHNARRFTKPFGQYLATYPSQNMGFVEVNNPELKRGLYLGAHDPIDRFKGFYFLEQTAGDRRNVAAWLIHYPFTPPAGTFEGAPFVAQFHDGDWVNAGRAIYRPWFIRTFGLVKPEDDWIRQNSFYQMIMAMLPEGNVNYTFREIPQLARDGLKHGLTSLQIAGWQRGGHDNGYPYYEPDPRLGTWRDLRRALRECHALGVKVYFFVNIHVSSLDTQWYKNELKNYDFETRKGHPGWVAGWGMGTLASRMALTAPLMSFADPSFPRLADAQLRYFRKLARVGADGLHVDKLYPSPINFNPRIVLSPDQSPWEGTTRLLARVSRECRAIQPHFRLSLETTWDRSLSFGASTWWAGNMSVARKVFPELVETVGLYQPYDYIGVNDAVRRGHAVMVAPYHFNRSMDCEPWRGLATYIRDVKEVRDELADYVFAGEPIDAGEAVLDVSRLPAGIEHAAYRNPKNGKRACIITHRGATSATVTFVGFGATRGGPVRLYRPAETPMALTTPAQITVGAERLALLVEE